MWLSIGSGDHLSSGKPLGRLPIFPIKNIKGKQLLFTTQIFTGIFISLDSQQKDSSPGSPLTLQYLNQIKDFRALMSSGDHCPNKECKYFAYFNNMTNIFCDRNKILDLSRPIYILSHVTYHKPNMNVSYYLILNRTAKKLTTLS